MRRPWYYAVWAFIGAVAAAFMTFGNVLDVLGNAAVWITRPVTLTGTAVVAALFALQAFVVKVFRPRWVVEGQTFIATQLKRQHWAIALGLLLLLWAPRFLTPPSRADGVSAPPAARVQPQP